MWFHKRETAVLGTFWPFCLQRPFWPEKREKDEVSKYVVPQTRNGRFGHCLAVLQAVSSRKKNEKDEVSKHAFS